MATMLKAPSDESVIRITANTLPPKPQVGRYVLLAAILGSSMVFLDSSVVNIALPLLQTDVHATTTVQWVMEIYLIFIASFILVGGILGDHYGRRRIFVIGMVIFILASVCCGFAPNLAVLLLARAIQGLGGALLIPGSLAIISGSFNDQQRERAIGIWSAGIAIAVLGIVITSVFNSSLDSHLAHLPLSPGVRHMVDTQRVKLAGIQLPTGTTRQVHAALNRAVGESFVSGFRLAALLCAGLALTGALCGWVMIEEPSRRTSHILIGERAAKENELSISTERVNLPASHL